MGNEKTNEENTWKGGNTWWAKVKAKHGIRVYGVFKKQMKSSGGGIKGVGVVRAKLIVANVLTAGLVNIYFRYQQDKGKGKGTTGKPITETHSSPLERKTALLYSLCQFNCTKEPDYYYQFPHDLNSFLRKVLGLPREDRTLDERFPFALEIAAQSEAVGGKLTELLDKANEDGSLEKLFLEGI